MKKYVKTFGERPETVVVLRTKVFFNDQGIAEVSDDVAEVLEAIPGYEFVGEGESAPKKDKTPTDPPTTPEDNPVDPASNPDPAGSSTPEENTSEDDNDNEETADEYEQNEEVEEVVEAPKPTKARAPRKPTTRR